MAVGTTIRCKRHGVASQACDDDTCRLYVEGYGWSLTLTTGDLLTDEQVSERVRLSNVLRAGRQAIHAQGAQASVQRRTRWLERRFDGLRPSVFDWVPPVDEWPSTVTPTLCGCGTCRKCQRAGIPVTRYLSVSLDELAQRRHDTT